MIFVGWTHGQLLAAAKKHDCTFNNLKKHGDGYESTIATPTSEDENTDRRYRYVTGMLNELYALNRDGQVSAHLENGHVTFNGYASYVLRFRDEWYGSKS